jgi:putative peptidoglycan lipid II flippase
MQAAQCSAPPHVAAWSTMDSTTGADDAASHSQAASSGSFVVAAGILLSRVAGLVRERVFAGYFGTSLYADVFRAGLRMPNVLQNLLGEGTLSASFIPVYAELLEQGRTREAGRVAGAIFALLLALAGGLTFIGVALAPVLVGVFLPGFTDERRELAIAITRILFPMAGVLVLSAWSLGILNSHRRFFVPYVAPVLWNAAMIATLVALGGRLPPDRLVVALAWGALLGGGLQFVVQLPWVLRLERELRPSWFTRVAGAREAVRNAGPAILGRGVVQISGWIDLVLASFLATGAVAAIGYAQVIYILPVSLFGMSVAAAELPELSRRRGEAVAVLRDRARAALARVAFYVLPSFVAFLALGDVIVAALYQTGEFDRADTLLVYATLGAYALGLLASTWSRLLASTLFALRDTRTPARCAAVRVTASAVLGAALMIQFEAISPLGPEGPRIGPGLFGGVTIGGQPLGAVGLALGAGIAAWIELLLLRRALTPRIGAVVLGATLWARMWGAALAAGATAWAIRWLLPELHPVLTGAVVLGGYGAAYFGVAHLLGVHEATLLVSRLWRRTRGSRESP